MKAKNRLIVSIAFTMLSSCYFGYAVAKPGDAVAMGLGYVGFVLGCGILLFCLRGSE